MGQILRIMSYSYAANREEAITALRLAQNHDLSWYRLDDGVMGGRSYTQHTITTTTKTTTTTTTTPVSLNDHDNGGDKNVLIFTGFINTDGGGFCSIRSEFPPGLLTGTVHDLANRAIKLRYRGDGKTYKVLLSHGTGSGPLSQTPSWQVDLPTTTPLQQSNDSSLLTAETLDWDETVITLNRFLPSFGGKKLDENKKYELHPSDMRQIGLMLSLKLSNGQPNPVETFGSGIFPFSLHVQSIEFLEIISVNQD